MATSESGRSRQRWRRFIQCQEEDDVTATDCRDAAADADLPRTRTQHSTVWWRLEDRNANGGRASLGAWLTA